MKQIKKIKSTPTTPPTFGVIDSLNSTSVTDSLSANMGNYIKQLMSGDILYFNNNGVNTGNITLSANCDDYEYIEVYGFSNFENRIRQVYTKFDKPYNLGTLQANTFINSNSVLVSNMTFNINNNILSIVENAATYTGNAGFIGTTSNLVFITRVVGKKI